MGDRGIARERERRRERILPYPQGPKSGEPMARVPAPARGKNLGGMRYDMPIEISYPYVLRRTVLVNFVTKIYYGPRLRGHATALKIQICILCGTHCRKSSPPSLPRGRDRSGAQ